MFTYTDDGLTLWQRRAISVSLINFRGKTPRQMSDAEIQVAFEYLRDHGGISYIWH
jgi:hypothetical protein